MGKLSSFLRESKQEFKKINWPTRRETVRLVFVVVSISLVVAFFLGAWDYIYLKGLEAVVPEAQEIPVDTHIDVEAPAEGEAANENELPIELNPGNINSETETETKTTPAE